MDTTFAWMPGEGIDPAALTRLQAHFPRPRLPMGEAWFMGEKRRMFPELLGSLDAVEPEVLADALWEIASGTGSFGQREEWYAWHHHLLAHYVKRSHEASVYPLLELLITGVMAHYPRGITSPPYAGFRDDILKTLGHCLMEPRCWSGQDIALGEVLHRSNQNSNGVWCWWNASGDLSASLFLCLKYLPTAQVAPWFRSVLQIASPHWRGQVLVWLVGAHEQLRSPAQWPFTLEPTAYPAVSWEASYCLKPVEGLENPAASGHDNWLPEASCQIVIDEVRAYFTDDVFLAWLESFSRDDALQFELANIPSAFERLYR
jgi:hypothetical protein